MSDTDKLIAAIFAVGYCHKLSVPNTEDYLYHYGKFLDALSDAEAKGDETPGIIKDYAKLVAKQGGSNA